MHENHAIDVMAVVIAFDDPIPDRLFNKVLKASEAVAVENGLVSRHLTQGFQYQMAVGLQGVQQPFPPGVSGRLYNAIEEASVDKPGSAVVVEQLRLQQNAIIYRAWKYIPWSRQLERILTLLSPALGIVKEIMAVASLRLEYLDRFKFDGQIDHADPKGLLKAGNPLIAEQIFSAPDLWHSHTGSFVETAASHKILRQILIDAVDQPIETNDKAQVTARFINITLAREFRFMPDPEESFDFDHNFLSQKLVIMHDDLKHDLELLILDEFVALIGLWEPEK